MGTIELDSIAKQLFIRSNILLYGNAATAALAQQCAEEIETMWNEPEATVHIRGEKYQVIFIIKGYLFDWLKPEDIFENTNPKNNYFRVEEYVEGNISFVDGLGCNTGFFKLENLYKGSTTAAHEYGHTLGLAHPEEGDIRGQGVPGIMYARGTLVDAHYQYEPEVQAGMKGGTMHPMHRKVKQQDIDELKLSRYNFAKQDLIIGEFSSIYHQVHEQ